AEAVLREPDGQDALDEERVVAGREALVDERREAPGIAGHVDGEAQAGRPVAPQVAEYARGDGEAGGERGEADARDELEVEGPLARHLDRDAHREAQREIALAEDAAVVLGGDQGREDDAEVPADLVVRASGQGEAQQERSEADRL